MLFELANIDGSDQTDSLGSALFAHASDLDCIVCMIVFFRHI